jgi:glycosyltransferase involved in cell wall biosynthesis
MIEAMSCGLPVMGTDVQGINEVIDHGVNGWLCGTSVLEIRNGIKFLIEHKTLRMELGKTGRQFILENYSLEMILKKEIELYREIMNE